MKRSTPGSDATSFLSVHELAAVLRDLGVETANVTRVVVDEKGFAYHSNPLHLPVYRVVPAIGPVTQANPQSVDT